MIEENYTKERKIPMSDCIFCKIIAGEIPSATIYENDEFKVILDRFPSGEGACTDPAQKPCAKCL